jgi:hypothetical protein
MIGAHTVGTKAGISLNGTSTGVTANNNFGFTTPLSDLGIWSGYAFSNRFAVNLDFDYGDFRWGYNGPSLGLTFSFGERSWEH